MQALAIIFSTVYQNRLVFRGLSKQWSLFTDPRLDIALMDIEDALIHILGVFQEVWKYTAVLIGKLNKESENLSQLMKLNCSQQVSIGFHKMLSQNICIRNKSVSEELCLSPKTTIKYLKQLEEERLLFSIKHGREVFYFNNTVIGLLKQMTEVLHNGADKS
jgi:hypothetical protein